MKRPASPSLCPYFSKSRPATLLKTDSIATIHLLILQRFLRQIFIELSTASVISNFPYSKKTQKILNSF